MTSLKDRFKKIFSSTRELQYVGIANLSTKGIAGVFWLVVASLMTPDKYGEIGYFIAIATMATRLSEFGASQTIIVYTAKKIPIRPAVYFISLCLGFVSSIVLYFIFNELAISVYAIGALIFDLATASLLGQKLYKKYAKLFIIQKALSTIVALGLFFVIGPMGLILGLGLSFFFVVSVLIRDMKHEILDFKLIRPRLGFMLNSYGMNIEKIFAGQLDKIIIAPLLGFTLLGNYNLGFQFLGLILILPSLVYTYTLPRDASGLSTKKVKKVMILSSIVFASLGIVLAPTVLPVFFPQFTSAVTIIQILSLYIIPNSISLAYTSHYLGQEKSKFVLIGQVVSIATYIIGIYTLGQIYGINGVAAAFVLSGAFQTVFYLIIKKSSSGSKDDFPDKTNDSWL